MSSAFFACDYSQEVGEQLFATAPQTEHWLLLEYPRAWSAKAYEESSIPAEVKTHIDAQLAAMPLSRLQVISQGNREPLTNLTAYIIHAGYDVQRIRRFTLPSYEALLDLPLAEIATGKADMGESVTQPLFIVCTNGKRDICCSRHGLPVYQALKAAGAGEVWQSNHIAGHRFAGTLVAFPHGVYYGRMTAEAAPALAAAVGAGEMYLPHSRGRACLAPAAQAAEHFLRQQTGVAALAAFAEPQMTAIDGGWQASFGEHRLVLAEELSSFDVINNSAEQKGTPAVQYWLRGIETS
jgi:hypothetical protein